MRSILALSCHLQILSRFRQNQIAQMALDRGQAHFYPA